MYEHLDTHKTLGRRLKSLSMGVLVGVQAFSMNPGMRTDII